MGLPLTEAVEIDVGHALFIGGHNSLRNHRRSELVGAYTCADAHVDAVRPRRWASLIVAKNFGLAPSPQSPHNPSMEKSKPIVTFEAVRDKDLQGWHVVITLTDGQKPQVAGFKTEDEAKRWIARESKSWLEGYSGGRYA